MRLLSPSASRAAAFVAATVSLAGCSGTTEQAQSTIAEKAVEQAIEKNSPGNVDVDLDPENNKVTVKSTDGTAVLGDDLPEDFPDVPMLKGTVGAAHVGPESNTALVSVDSSVNDAANEAARKLAEAGYSSQSVETGTGLSVAKYRNSEWNVMVQIGQAPDSKQAVAIYTITPAK